MKPVRGRSGTAWRGQAVHVLLASFLCSDCLPGKIDLQNLELEVCSLDSVILELLPGTHQPGRGDDHRWSIGPFGKGVLYLNEGNLQAGNVHDATEVCL